jgi:hypothetical protein
MLGEINFDLRKFSDNTIVVQVFKRVENTAQLRRVGTKLQPSRE